jgi:hypothetical protein
LILSLLDIVNGSLGLLSEVIVLCNSTLDSYDVIGSVSITHISENGESCDFSLVSFVFRIKFGKFSSSIS